MLLAACGGGGDSAAGPPQPAGSLTVGSCTIAEGAPACTAPVSWTTTNATSPRVLLGSATVAATAAGSLTAPIGTVTQTVTLLDGATELDTRSVVGTCVSASAWDGSACRPFAVRTVERAPTPFVESGGAVTLEIVVYKPLRSGPVPAVMFNHDSTGSGDDPSQFRITYTNEAIARFFADRDWLVAFPQRRGRGASNGLWMKNSHPIAPGIRASRRRHFARRCPCRRARRRAPRPVRRCSQFRRRLVGRGLRGLGRRESFELRPRWHFPGHDNLAVRRQRHLLQSHSRANFDAFIAAGRTGTFRIFTRAPSLNGHFIVNDASLWSDDLDTFVRSIGRG